jgi:hypothetical protein
MALRSLAGPSGTKFDDGASVAFSRSEGGTHDS